MRAARATVGGLLLSLMFTPLVLTDAAAGAAPPSVGRPVLASPEAKPRGGGHKDAFVPSTGVTFNDPLRFGTRRTIITKVIRSIQETPKGEKVRIVTWNFDDRPAMRALLAAKRRGVKVQVVVSGSVANPNWSKLRRGLNRNRTDHSFAVKCTGGCRSRVRIMHSKLYMFSRIHKAEHISMFGSSNLTTPAGNRQWNDLLTTRSKKVYAYLAGVFDQYAKDKSLKTPFDAKTLGDYRIWVYPLGDRNPQLGELKKVKCRGATGHTGNGAGRTKIRIAVAGWFDSYGEDIAQQLRKLWDKGCDIKIVTTLAGRGVNQTLKAGNGRGPVPIQELTVDRNFDGIPERYLHQKSIAISGVFGKDTSASVVLTGSPNWSTRAQRSEELWFRLLDHTRTTRRYLRHVDQLFASPYSSRELLTPADLQRGLAARRVAGGTALPDWLELD
jgi:phosphatidylserine/phosphatidylglycerophosphate/cardiolipin synthase-like enzyme